jgi:phenylalanyl-tRNA synthetase beta chain
VEDVGIYPSVSRDMAIIVDDSVTHGDVLKVVHKVAPPELTGTELFDMYSGEGLGGGKRSLAYSFTYCSVERTLTDDEVNELHNSVKSAIVKELAVEVREG